MSPQHFHFGSKADGRVWPPSLKADDRALITLKIEVLYQKLSVACIKHGATQILHLTIMKSIQHE